MYVMPTGVAGFVRLAAGRDARVAHASRSCEHAVSTRRSQSGDRSCQSNPRSRVAGAARRAWLLAAAPAAAQKKYGPGATDTEIKIGQTMPYSGPASAYGTIGKAEAAYFKMINEQGGINGRKINLISLDDGYSPPKTVEQVRKLVEQDEVLALFQTLGTPQQHGDPEVHNAKKVPQLFVATGATKWGDPKNFPWTMGCNPSYQAEAHDLRRSTC